MSNDVEVRWDRLTAPDLRAAVKDRTVVKGQRLLAAIAKDVADALADQRLWDAPI